MKQASRLKIDFQTACFDRTFNCVCCGSCIRTITACSLIVPTQPRNVGFARETARVGTISRRQRRNRTHEQAGRLKIDFQTACFDRLPTVFAAAAAFVLLWVAGCVLRIRIRRLLHAMS